jgi:thymidylate synthase
MQLVPMSHDDVYIKLVLDVMSKGVRKPNRTGTDTFAVFSRQLRFDLSDGTIPMLTTKKMHTRSIIHELLWYIRGDSNIKYLQDNGVRIWNEWADENGDLGPVYGFQWRNWPTPEGKVDQIAELIDKLRNNPTDRRLIVSAWNVGQLHEMALPPCHYTFQFYTRPLSEEESEQNGGKQYALSLMLNQRSCDVGLGVPFNIVQYGFLLHMMAQVANMVPEEFIWNGGDTHVYENHMDALLTQTLLTPYESPKLKLNPDVKEIDDFKFEDFEIVGYRHHPIIKMEVSV